MNRLNMRQVSYSIGELTKQNKRLLEQVEELLKERIKRQELEVALEKSEIKFHIMADNAFNWECWTRPDGSIIYVSPAFERITGYLVDDYLANPHLIEKIIHPDDLENFKQHLIEENDNPLEIFQFDFKIITQNREVKLLRHYCKPVYNLDGKFAGRRSSNTEINLSENNPGQSVKNKDFENELLNEVFESISQPIYVINVDDYSIVRANKAAGKINIGDKPKCYQTTHKVNEPCNDPGHPCPLDLVKKNKKPVVVKHKHFDKEGNIRFYNVYGYPIYNGNGKLIRMIEHAVDITETELANEALKESDEKLKKITESAKDAIIIMNGEGTITYLNNSVETMFGFSRDELLDKNLHDIIVPEKFRNIANEALRKFSQTGDGEAIGKTLELYGLRKDDTEFPCELSLSAIRVKNEWNAIGIIRDITERKEAEKKLRLLQKSIIQNPSAIIITDKVGNIEYMNKRATDLSGYSLDEVYGNNLTLYKPDSMDDKELKSVLSTISNGKEWKGEFQNKKKNGELFWVSVVMSPVIDENGKTTHYIVMMQDITEQKLLALKVKQSEEEFRNIYENSTLGIYRSTPAGEIILANPAFISILGYSSFNELKYVNADDLYVNKEDRQIFRQIMERDGVVHGFETKIKKKDGSVIDISLNGKRMTDANGSIVFYEGILEDISIKKEAERELIAAKEKAVEMNNLKSSLLTNMSHELRTPLIGIIGYAELLKDEITDEPLKEMVDNILKSGNRLTHTLELILDLAMLESKSLTLNFEKVNLVETLDELICPYEIAAKKKGLQFKFVKNLPGLYCSVDLRLLNRAINYVLDNAIKFTSHGIIEVRVSSDKTGIIQISDTGIGIPKNKIGSIFDPFRQASEGYSRSFEGTGLGLTLAKKFIESLGGTISVKSEENVGSTFTIKIPLAD